MKTSEIQITFRKGRRFAAYLYLESSPRKAKRTKRFGPSLLVDFDEKGRALGVEILAFDEGTVNRINDVLASIGHPVLSPAELAPLRAA